MSDFDEKFLGDTQYWGLDKFGRKRCHLKAATREMPRRFGVVYADDPLTVHETKVEGRSLSWKKETFPTVRELTKVWILD